MDPVLAAASAAVIDVLMRRQADVARSVQRQLASDITELRGDQEIIELLVASVEGNIDTIFDAMRHDISLENIEPPTAALEYARRLAQRGVPMNALVRAYRLGHSLVLEVAAEEIDNAGLDPRISLALYQRITSVTFRYIDWISQQVVAVYEEERDRWLSNRNSARALRVRDVLAGTVPASGADADAITAAIRYPMNRTHLGVVLWWPPGAERVDGLAQLESFLRAISEAVASQGSPLFVAADQLSGWGWIPLLATADPVDRLRGILANSEDAPRLALGSPLPGLEGFRRSHRQARRAHDVALAGDVGGVIATGDPGLAAAALMGQNLDEAREFVNETLGPLAGATDSDARLRDTLRVFLRHGGSYTAAADELTVHFNTVKYRVGRAVERRGRPIDTDRLDVELALLLCQWYRL